MRPCSRGRRRTDLGPDGPQGRRIGIDNPYEGPKAVLLQVVASANRCRMVWSRELGFGTVVGFEADLDSVEVLFTSLLVQATRTLASAGSRSTVHGGSRTRSFRQSFLAAFADRIGERLHEATAQAEEAAVAAHTNGRELVPLLAARAEEVDETAEHLVPRRASGQGRRGTRRRGLALRSVGRGPGPAGLGPQAAGLSGWPPLHDAPSPTPAGASDCRRVSASAS